MFAVVAYDVPAKRTEKYRKLLSRFLLGVQYSVFAGDISELSFRKLHGHIKHLMEDQDKVLIISAENRRNMRVVHWDSNGETEDFGHLGSGII